MTCPDCIEEMVKQTKKTMVGKRVFIVCQKCGYNVRKYSLMFYEKQEREIYNKLKKEKQHGNDIE